MNNLEKTCIVSIIYSKDKLNKVLSKLTQEHFTDFRNRIIFECIKQLYNRNIVVDLISIRSLIEKKGKNIISDDYYTEIAKTDTTINIELVIDELIETHKKNTLKKITADITDHIKINSHSANIISEIENNLLSLQTTEQLEIQSLSDIAKTSLSDKVDYYTTDVTDIDTNLVGMFAGELHIIGARPGKGKTTYCLHTAMKVAEKNPEKKVLFFSLEMSKEILEKKIALSHSKKTYNLKKVISGNISDVEKHEIELLRKNTYKYDNLMIIDNVYNYEKIITTIKIYAQQHDIAIVFIDYLQLLETNTKKDRHLQVGEISRAFKILSQDLKICIICPAQLGRAVDSRPGNIPLLSDLRESGNIEQDSDVIFFLVSNADNENITKIICAKNRLGATFITDVYFDKGAMKLNSLNSRSFFNYTQ